MALAGWGNLYQQQRIDFHDEEIEILLRQLGKRRLRLTDEERRHPGGRTDGSGNPLAPGSTAPPGRDDSRALGRDRFLGDACPVDPRLRLLVRLGEAALTGLLESVTGFMKVILSGLALLLVAEAFPDPQARPLATASRSR